MGSNFNFKDFTNDPTLSGGGERPPGNSLLTRQPSIYSLTFEEFQSTVGSGLGKDFGSMNMDELVKNIWSAEETQFMAAVGPSLADGTRFQEGLQRQGSLTLPRTLSQKTVDEVWKDISKELVGGSGGSNVGSEEGLNLTQRQQTLGEMTLEEFLVRAGVVREDNNDQLGGKFGANVGYLVNGNSAGLGVGLQQARGVGLGSYTSSSVISASPVSLQSGNSPLSVNGVRSNPLQQVAQLLHNQHQHQQRILPRQANTGYVTQVAPLQSNPGFRSEIGIDLMPGGGTGLVGLGGVATASPANQFSDGIAKSNGDCSSVSPVPYLFNGGLKGRRLGGMTEKVAERRQRRMIKNRESAARSRARKQAYTTELEAEIAKLKEENQELQKKRAELMDMQKNKAYTMELEAEVAKLKEENQELLKKQAELMEMQKK